MGEVRMRGSGGEACDTLHLAPHAEEQRIQRMASGREETAAPGIGARVPAELPVPRPDAMVIIDFAVMDLAEQALIDDRFGGEKLAGITALEADAALHASALHRLLHLAQVIQRKGDRFFDDQVLARLGGGDGLGGMVIRVTAYGNHIDVGAKQLLEIGIGAERSAAKITSCVRTACLRLVSGISSPRSSASKNAWNWV